jgi:hypothetical protein
VKESRREFLRTLGAAAASRTLAPRPRAEAAAASPRRHLLTLSFDDGFDPRQAVFNTHGLDDEGWGPVRATYLERLLERLLALPTVEILPAGRALARYAV